MADAALLKKLLVKPGMKVAIDNVWSAMRFRPIEKVGK